VIAAGQAIDACPRSRRWTVPTRRPGSCAAVIAIAAALASATSPAGEAAAADDPGAADRRLRPDADALLRRRHGRDLVEGAEPDGRGRFVSTSTSTISVRCSTVTGVALNTRQSTSRGPVGLRYVGVCPDNLAVSSLGKTPNLSLSLRDAGGT
jgi:hypothetical protein